MKLNLGCFQKKMYGFINVDIRTEVEPDMLEDIFTLKTFPVNSVDLIYACHVLEHASRETALLALKRWMELLRPNGILRVCVPNIEVACKHYITHGDLPKLLTTFWGSQKHPQDFHLNGWDYSLLEKDLTNCGYINIHKYNWWETEHYYVDDYSQAYIEPPVKTYKNGKPIITGGQLISLNVEAMKPNV